MAHDDADHRAADAGDGADDRAADAEVAAHAKAEAAPPKTDCSKSCTSAAADSEPTGRSSPADVYSLSLVPRSAAPVDQEHDQAVHDADFDKRQAEEQHERLEHELRRDPLPLSEDASRSCSSKMHACAALAGLAGSRATAAATASMCAARGVRLSAGRRRAAICVGADHPLSVWCAGRSSSMTARVARSSAAAGQASSGVEALVEASSRPRDDVSSRSRGEAWRRCAHGGSERGGRPRTGRVCLGRAHPAHPAPLVWAAVRVM